QPVAGLRPRRLGRAHEAVLPLADLEPATRAVLVAHGARQERQLLVGLTVAVVVRAVAGLERRRVRRAADPAEGRVAGRLAETRALIARHAASLDLPGVVTRAVARPVLGHAHLYGAARAV